MTVTEEVGSSLTERKTIRQTKTPESNRRVPIVKELSIILQEWMFMNSNVYLFCDKNGEFMDSTRNVGILNRISMKLDVKFNMCRLLHQFNTDLIMQNNDPLTIMELMGHNNTNMTISYARSNDEKKGNIK